MEINKIHCGDCLELMKDIPDNSVDMILCDLPYGTTACSWDTIIPFEPLWKQYKRIIKDNGAIVLTASQPFVTDLINSNRNMFKYDLIWNKKRPTGMLNSKYMPMKLHEHILIFYEQHPIYNPQFSIRKLLDRRPNRVKNNIKNPSKSSDCWKIKPKYSKTYDDTKVNPKSIIKFKKDYKNVHPTQKPVELFKYLIKTYTNENDLVLDNCMGSGTTAVACKQLNRNFIGIELSQQYVDIANKRLAKEQRIKNMGYFNNPYNTKIEK